MTHSMAIYIDDEPVQLDGSDLESVLAAATDHLATKKRIVVEVVVDGQPVVGDQLTEQQSKPVSDAELRLYSADPHELSVTTLHQVRVQLEEAKTAQSSAAELFQQDEQAKAMEQVARVIDAWQQTQQVVLYSVQLLNVGLNDKKVGDQSVEELTEGLISQLTNLHDLLRAQDTVGLADVLAYEWPETVDRWDQFIVELINWIEQGQDSTGA